LRIIISGVVVVQNVAVPVLDPPLSQTPPRDSLFPVTTDRQPRPLPPFCA
jgi:hypothetical protein